MFVIKDIVKSFYLVEIRNHGASVWHRDINNKKVFKGTFEEATELLTSLKRIIPFNILANELEAPKYYNDRYKIRAIV